MIGPSGAVHAVQLWTGPPDADPPRPPNVAAIEWSATSRLIELNAETRDPDEDYPFAGRVSLPAPEAFRHVARFDAAMNLISKALEPVPEDRWEGTAPSTARTVCAPCTWRCAACPHPTTTPGGASSTTSPTP